MVSYFTTHSLSYAGGFNLGGINASGQARNGTLYHVTWTHIHLCSFLPY